MRILFWVKRYFLAAVVVFAILALSGLVRGRSWNQVMIDSTVWAPITAGVFIAARIYHLSRGNRCAMCKDAPDEQSLPVA